MAKKWPPMMKRAGGGEDGGHDSRTKMPHQHCPRHTAQPLEPVATLDDGRQFYFCPLCSVTRPMDPAAARPCPFHGRAH